MELSTLEIFIRLAIAIALGGLVGVERTLAGKNAGMRTYALVSMGSAFFIIVSELVLAQYANTALSNPLIIASNIIVGIGFIGAGLVFHRGDNHTTGLTSAAGLWVAAGIGMAAGYGLYTPALIATLLTLLVFTILWYIEKGLKKISYGDERSEIENSERLHD
jgi:putative Mg2+ transporter-C (MgtC) family protein